jgi:hypothetical protein
LFGSEVANCLNRATIISRKFEKIHFFATRYTGFWVFQMNEKRGRRGASNILP